LRRASIQASEAFTLPRKEPIAADFVRGLHGRVTFDTRKDAANQRLLELINKTNQFNLNGVRLSEGKWLRHLAGPANFVVGVSYEDRFGPLGVIAWWPESKPLAALKSRLGVMSCRAFSRRIEFHTLEYLFGASGAENISLAFRSTAEPTAAGVPSVHPPRRQRGGGLDFVPGEIRLWRARIAASRFPDRGAPPWPPKSPGHETIRQLRSVGMVLWEHAIDG